MKPVGGDKLQEKNLLKEVWGAIEKVSHKSSGQGRIMEDFVMFTDSAKPTLRTGKGTVSRRPTLDLYSQEIDTLYAAATVDCLLDTSSNMVTSSAAIILA